MNKDLLKLHQEFMRECEFSSKLSKETLRGYQASFDLLMRIAPIKSRKDINSKMMTEFFKRLDKRERVVGKGIKKQGIKRSTVATYRSKLNKFFNWLAIKGYLDKNPFDDIEYPSVEYEDKKFLKKEEVEKIFTALILNINWANSFIKKRNIAIMSTFLYCGLRKGELIGLRAYDIDLERRLLTVRAETSKSKRERSIPLNMKVIEYLKDYLEKRKKKGYKTPCLFVSNNQDEGLTSDGLIHLIKKLNKEGDVNFHMHQLRHTFAINLLNNGTDIAKLKQLMGHRDIRMTASYLRCIPATAMQADVETLSLDNLM
ncbi:MAG: tyrosine-type recombinase/integrase [Parcubacteria group bacterium]|nr:tyrosine-type recombinase/integrase [Parcubacteria group bacterium]